jgi:hypothetical protein
MKVNVFWDVTLCNLVDVKAGSEECTASILYPEDEGSAFLRNVSKHLQGLHRASSQKTMNFIDTAARISDVVCLSKYMRLHINNSEIKKVVTSTFYICHHHHHNH